MFKKLPSYSLHFFSCELLIYLFNLLYFFHCIIILLYFYCFHFTPFFLSPTSSSFFYYKSRCCWQFTFTLFFKLPIWNSELVFSLPYRLTFSSYLLQFLSELLFFSVCKLWCGDELANKLIKHDILFLWDRDNG